MRLDTTQDVFDLLDGGVTAAALGAAMELGLFWLLAEEPLPVREVAKRLNVPYNRCLYWLQLLSKIGLVQESAEGYEPTAKARETILDVYSRDAWAFLAWGLRGEEPAAHDLAETIAKPQSTWELQGRTPPDYLEQIRGDAVYAERFTRMLYEIHVGLARQVAGMLDLRGVKRMMDLGGGSGVISHALLRANPGLASVVMDDKHVCPIGQEIARENKLEDRVTYVAGDFVSDELPAGCDMALFCDVGAKEEGVLGKVHQALNDGGRLVIVDKYAPDGNTAVPSRLVWAFFGALERPAETTSHTTVEDMKLHVEQAGFRDVAAREVPAAEMLRWDADWTLIEANK